MKKTLTTEQISDIYNLLARSKSNSLEDADRIKVIMIRQAVKAIGSAYSEFEQDAQETLKFENFDDLNAKAQARMLTGEQLLAWNLGVVAYTKSLKKATEAEKAKEHEVEIDTLSQATFLKLSKENDWGNAAYDILAPIIK